MSLGAMQIDWWTLGFQALNVLILIWLLSRFFFRPVAAIIEKRQAAAMKLLDDARSTEAAARAERDKAAAETARIAADRAARLKKAADDAETEKAAVLAAARAKADEIREATQAEIGRLRKSEAAAAEGRASRLAVEIAAKLMTRLPDSAKVEDFIDGLVAGLMALPETSRVRIGSEDKLPLKAARSLTASEAQACTAALVHALGRPVEIVVEADPGLIAGLEIDAPHAVVRNSLRADLDRITAELAGHDDYDGR